MKRTRGRDDSGLDYLLGLYRKIQVQIYIILASGIP